MSELVKPRSKSKQRRNDQKCSQGIETVVAQQLSDDQLKQKEAPPAKQGITPDQGKEAEGGPVAQEPDGEVDLWELAEPKTWDEGQSQV
ncbi:putative G antigen family E member 3 [Mustela erminea]|uniref:putative G antigen family E member 3 n=1 Tax=Mustela erminea TaxID=36723 RepID=UPI001386FD8A|nr:putative G antigen family E member 3 [Mustela erminea]